MQTVHRPEQRFRLAQNDCHPIGQHLDAQAFRQHKQIVGATQITGHPLLNQGIHPVECVSRQNAGLVLGMAQGALVVFVPEPDVAIALQRLAFLREIEVSLLDLNIPNSSRSGLSLGPEAIVVLPFVWRRPSATSYKRRRSAGQRPGSSTARCWSWRLCSPKCWSTRKW